MKYIYIFTTLSVVLSCGSAKHEDNEESAKDSATSASTGPAIELIYTWDADTLFESWNAATRKALADAQPTAGQRERDTYETTLKYFNQNEGTDAEPNQLSYRRKFLNRLKQDTVALPEVFFLIEADRSGELYERNMYLAFAEGARLKIYHYKHDISREWKSDSILYKENNFTKPLSSYKVPTSEGRNNDKVSITKFQGNRAIESSYYLSYTLSRSIGLEELIEIGFGRYRK